jgi:hypothetical protein
VRAAKDAASDDERDDAIARIAEEQANSGVLKKMRFVPRSRNKTSASQDCGSPSPRPAKIPKYGRDSRHRHERGNRR